MVLDGAGGGLGGPENQTFTVEVRSGGEIIASEVVTLDCAPVSPSVEISAELACADGAAQGTVTVTNNGPAPVTVTATADGIRLGTPVVVAPGATRDAARPTSRRTRTRPSPWTSSWTAPWWRPTR